MPGASLLYHDAIRDCERLFISGKPRSDKSLRVVWWLASRCEPRYSLVAPSLREFPITLTELKLMAALATIGVTNPNAARGKLSAL